MPASFEQATLAAHGQADTATQDRLYVQVLALGASASAVFYHKDAQRIQREIDALDSLRG